MQSLNAPPGVALAGPGSAILVSIEQGYLLVLGGGGERILYRPEGTKLPKKTHLLLRFEDESALTVTVQGWGNTLLLEEGGADGHPHVRLDRVPPLSRRFTRKYFNSLWEGVDPDSSRSVKYFLISEPGVWGIGNGCLQDILYNARIHPKRRAADLETKERAALYEAIVGTLTEMVKQGGRYDERDLYGDRGRYVRILDNKTRGKPCPACGTAVEKSQYLGGAIYYCPACQR